MEKFISRIFFSAKKKNYFSEDSSKQENLFQSCGKIEKVIFSAVDQPSTFPTWLYANERAFCWEAGQRLKDILS